MSDGVMLLVERAYSDGSRLFVADCQHGRSEFMVQDYGYRTDPARAAGYFGQLVRNIRRSAKDDPDVEDCQCSPRNQPLLQ